MNNLSAVLFDTNVVSELVRQRPDASVVAYVEAQSDPYISSITIHELIYGAERAPPARRAKLLGWIAALRSQFSDRIIGINADIAAEAGRLRAAAEAQGHVIEALDSLIAACALSRAAVLATRNTRYLEALGVVLANPWRI